MTGTGPSLLLAAAAGYGAIGGSFERAFASAGCRVATVNNRDYLPLRLSRAGRLRNRLIRRRAVADYNRNLAANARAAKPDLLVVLKGALILPETLERIREELPGTRMININYDNYFSRAAANDLGDLRALIELYDVFFPSKKDNVEKLRELGAREVRYLPIGYDPCVHYPVMPTAAETEVYGRAVAFIGTCTPERVRFLEGIAGTDLGIWGGHWDRVPRRLRGAVKNTIACGREFSLAVGAARITLNFLRRENCDTHNQRTFEIPACGGFMLSQRTEELEEFFTEGTEYAAFSSVAELAEKTVWYLDHDREREEIARQGRERLRRGAHTIQDRVSRILETIGA